MAGEAFNLRSCKGYNEAGEAVDCGHRLKFQVLPMCLDDAEAFIAQVGRLQVLKGLGDLAGLSAEARAEKIREASRGMVSESRDAIRQLLGLGLHYAFPDDYDLGRHLDAPIFKAFKEAVWRVNEFDTTLDPYQPAIGNLLLMLVMIRVSSALLPASQDSTTSASSSGGSKSAQAGKPAAAAPIPAPANPSPSTGDGTAPTPPPGTAHP